MYELEHDQDGWWAYYKDGWKSSFDPCAPIHFDHEGTKREILRRIREAVPCDCDECLEAIQQQTNEKE